ncbi:hypothetical protein WH297_23935 [Ochrobactrum vermis]|uniref:Uncharacterized protein n=1 Tax=Ochrobactrum vermis TaxID=1827297 RepID=A0ABU8PKK9_9HYPH|nr:hypothetical protein [Ochrobactrum vermis]
MTFSITPVWSSTVDEYNLSVATSPRAELLVFADYSPVVCAAAKLKLAGAFTYQVDIQQQLR